MTYDRNEDARTAIQEFDGANAKGQPIQLTMVVSGKEGTSLLDRVERPQASLFDRIERPNRHMYRNLSDGSSDEEGNGDDDDEERGPSGPRKIPSKLAPPGRIDRYVPGGRARSPVQMHGWGNRAWNSPPEHAWRPPPARHPVRRQVDRRPIVHRGRGGRDGRPTSDRQANGTGKASTRPRKTQEELDQEMDDYWSTPNDTSVSAGVTVAPATAVAVEAPGAAGPSGENDVEMGL